MEQQKIPLNKRLMNHMIVQRRDQPQRQLHGQQQPLDSTGNHNNNNDDD